jgi:hypothetical protein
VILRYQSVWVSGSQGIELLFSEVLGVSGKGVLMQLKFLTF